MTTNDDAEVAATRSEPGMWRALRTATCREARDLVGVADGALADAGDPEGETTDLLAGELVQVPLLRHGALRLTGADRIDFLNGQLSQDVRRLGPLGAALGMLLDHRGRSQADVTVIRRADDLYAAVDDGRVAAARATLAAHVVFDQVEIEDLSSRLVALVVSGRDVAAAVDAALAAPPGTAASVIAAGPGGPVAAVPFEGGTVVLHARRRSHQPSLDVHALARAGDAVAERLALAGARLAGEVALAAGRIDAAIGASAAEGVDALPQEAGLEGRISYRKGCYLGQEIMARIEGRGTLRRGLTRLALESAPAQTSDRDVRDEAGRVVGRVGTAAWTPGGWAALAVLRLDLPPGVPLRTLGADARLVTGPHAA